MALLPRRLVVTNPAVRRGTAHIKIFDPKLLVTVDMKNITLKEDTIVDLIAHGYLNGSGGWVPPCPYHQVPPIRCKLAAYPKSAIIPHISLPILPVLEHFFFEHTFSVTDWMTLQLDWTTSPLLQTITTIYLEC
jgi:hypothetical protein